MDYHAEHMGIQSTGPGGIHASRGPRVEMKEIVYVMGPEEPAFVLNLSESGMAVQAMDILQPGQSLRFALPLPDRNREVHGVARIVWSDRSGRAGFEFTELSDCDRSQLRRWIVEHVN